MTMADAPFPMRDEKTPMSDAHQGIVGQEWITCRAFVPHELGRSPCYTFSFTCLRYGIYKMVLKIENPEMPHVKYNAWHEKIVTPVTIYTVTAVTV